MVGVPALIFARYHRACGATRSILAKAPPTPAVTPSVMPCSPTRPGPPDILMVIEAVADEPTIIEPEIRFVLGGTTVAIDNCVAAGALTVVLSTGVGPRAMVRSRC